MQEAGSVRRKTDGQEPNFGVRSGQMLPAADERYLQQGAGECYFDVHSDVMSGYAVHQLAPGAKDASANGANATT